MASHSPRRVRPQDRPTRTLRARARWLLAAGAVVVATASGLAVAALSPGTSASSPVTTNFTFAGPTGFSQESLTASASSPTTVAHGATFQVSIPGGSQVVPTTQSGVGVNYIDNTTEYYEVPAGTTVAPAGVVAAGQLSWTGGTNSSLPASGSATMVITVCTVSGQSGCNASNNTALVASAGTYSGFAGPNPTLPYIEVSTGTTQIPAGATLTTPTITVNLTASGTTGTVLNWTQFEFKTAANITLGIPITIPVDGWPSAGTYTGAAVTTLPLPAALLYGAPPVITSTTITGAATAPGAPTIGTATEGNTQASVSFTAPASDGGSAITSYTVTAHDSTTPSNGGQTASGPSSPIAVTGLTNGDSYTFTVTATNGVGTGPASAASNAVTPSAPTAPGAPTIGTATGGNAQASVSFTAPASDGGSAITSYTVTAQDSTTPSNGGQTANGASSPIAVTGLTNGDSYTFTVTATNAVGTGPASAASNAVTPTSATTVPGAPTIGTATAGTGQATVTWTAPSSDGGSSITGYTVTSSPGGVTATASASATSATVTGLNNGTAYTFTVTATNANGTGSASAPSNSVTPGPNNPVTLNFAINAANMWSITQTVANWGAEAASTAHIVRPHDSGVSVQYGNNFDFVSAASSQQIPTSQSGIAVNYITATQQIYPLPDGTTYVGAAAAGPGTYSGGPSSNPSGSFTLAVNYCTAPSPSCTATTTATPTFLGATTGPYIEIGLGSAQIPAGATLNLPEVTVTLKGTSTETVNWTESEFQTTANINLVGNNISIPVKGYPTAATTVPSAGPAPALLSPPPTLASVTVTAAAHASVPGAPTENSVTAGDANATITWAPPADNGGSPITGYVITPSSGSPVTVGNVTKYAVTGLSNGTPYTFTVAATNPAGTGPQSNALAPVTPMAATTTAAVAPVKTVAFTGANLDKEFVLGVALLMLGGLLLLTRRLVGRRRRTT